MSYYSSAKRRNNNSTNKIRHNLLANNDGCEKDDFAVGDDVYAFDQIWIKISQDESMEAPRIPGTSISQKNKQNSWMLHSVGKGLVLLFAGYLLPTILLFSFLTAVDRC